MYLSSLRLENFRGFENTLIEFHPGINALIGENNSGKTTVMRAMALLFGRQGRMRPTARDFHRKPGKQTAPPRIRVTAIIRSSGAEDTLEDRALVASWLTRLEPPWEACLTYTYSLPEEEVEAFTKAVKEDPSPRHYWEAVEEFVPKYVAHTLGGNPENQLKADAEALSKFEFQFLDALRDADSEMLSGAAPLLRTMLVNALDKDKDDPTKARLRALFKTASDQLVAQILKRTDLTDLLDLATSTGAEDGGTPSLAGSIDEGNVLSALGLVLADRDVTIPASHVGLGYKNLLYMSLVMAQIDLAASKERRGQNAVVFPMLAIEEPEAHLHPTQQHKLLKYIKKRLKDGQKGRCRQVFLSTHSTHVTSAVGLDSIIWLASRSPEGQTRVGYPGRCFPSGDEGTKSKHYVERYLDATKSNMLFARGILLVEGIAEQLLLPVLGEYLGIPLEGHHVAIVTVNGVNFRHFLPLFGGTECVQARSYAIPRRVACVIDADPTRKRKAPKSRYRKCWPYQLNIDVEAFDYKPQSDALTRLQEDCIRHASNLRLFNAQKTFEYDLAGTNLDNTMLPPGDCDHQSALEAFVTGDSTAPEDCVLDSDEREALKAVSTDQSQNRKARFATCFLCCAQAAKGEHAFLLSQTLRDHLEQKTAAQAQFAVPEYIRGALKWVCPTKVE